MRTRCFSPSVMRPDALRANRRTKMNMIRQGAIAALLAMSVAASHAQSAVSELSALSALPIAVSVAAPVLVLSAGATLTVVAVEVSAAGAVWVLERASDGARATL